jgi:hypothetical protein
MDYDRLPPKNNGLPEVEKKITSSILVGGD